MIHAVENPFEGPAPMLVLFSPGAPRAAFFWEPIDNAARERQLSPAERTAIPARHDPHAVDPTE